MWRQFSEDREAHVELLFRRSTEEEEEEEEEEETSRGGLDPRSNAISSSSTTLNATDNPRIFGSIPIQKNTGG